jgi:quercetin dioxygenase-like cupin family protein
VVKLNDQQIMRATFEPGWRWSESVKPIVKTESCQVHHLNYFLSGHMHVQMDDGSTAEFGPGDLADIPPGHNAWVVGDEACVMLDYAAAAVYAKPKS